MKTRAVLAGIWCVLVFSGTPAAAHCDTLDGPVAQDARTALEKADVALVLKWVAPADEAALREAFTKTIAVRQKGPEARELADRYFLETAVRLHRAAEGEPFTGLKAAGTPVSPAVTVAEKALAAGNAEALKNFLNHAVQEGAEEKFKEAAACAHYRPGDVAAGRSYARAYVALMHYAENIYAAARAGALHQEPGHGR